ncbi:flagellar basal body P-ring formation chaperone FlgA [Leptospira borgpetersenii]|uniref:Endoflagellar basal body P-ring biosynthesis protein n=2 Tax=Leptospira borgpetersenii serovar Hardjo-bovis TaxID=338217 RepID=Q04RZ3_LEPBJ|nr:flagellar basal body P-ring formation chaperone FlgA [Leptospira borgpetersenii]ABJ76327.1 Endoflagellar basal body P-ring biosynthesis protein [Leptospira borgpetersenii serovar Hardjo-bovis str. JB197]ABJ78608.1 Endoflagellar basal body P-ring biosynthesis protein [Leptospira borgpetersenii serovar Hardjo-bovis str. L550]AMX57881.1 endoflagellar basal body P-ring biosynthesis protein [Leptospira borgpetersenii serovar Hardjo]AMX61113.1 endoflagellar basal body P-ring biosynthesis protein [
MNLIRILILFALGADSLWGSGIYLKGRVIVEGEEVRLSSVARIPDGFENRVLIQNLKRPVFVGPKDILKIYGDLNPIVVGKETLVLPLNHILKPEEIEESLTNEIKKKHPNEEFKLTFLSGDIKVPSEGVQLRWANLSSRLHPGQLMASLEIFFQNQKVHTLRIRFQVEQKIKVLKASRLLNKGVKIVKEDFKEEEVLTSEEILDSPGNELLGSTLLKDMNEGEIFRKKHVRKIQDVQRGGEILMIYHKGSLVLKAKVKALSSGNIGEEVQVTAHSREGQLRAKVVDKNTVIAE